MIKECLTKIDFKELFIRIVVMRYLLSGADHATEIVTELPQAAYSCLGSMT